MVRVPLVGDSLDNADHAIDLQSIHAPLTQHGATINDQGACQTPTSPCQSNR
jgi:hypothetical protein